jgi:hypothetical protein
MPQMRTPDAVVTETAPTPLYLRARAASRGGAGGGSNPTIPAWGFTSIPAWGGGGGGGNTSCATSPHAHDQMTHAHERDKLHVHDLPQVNSTRFNSPARQPNLMVAPPISLSGAPIPKQPH